MSIKETLIEELKRKDVRVGILGLGYVGLPLAVVWSIGLMSVGLFAGPRSGCCNFVNRGGEHVDRWCNHVARR